MLISEVIRLLTELLNEHGDQPLYVGAEGQMGEVRHVYCLPADANGERQILVEA